MEHLQGWHSSTTVQTWINELVSLHLFPDWKVLEFVESTYIGHFRENRLIKQYQARGEADLNVGRTKQHQEAINRGQRAAKQQGKYKWSVERKLQHSNVMRRLRVQKGK